ncbi:hypothetical protein ED236_09250 [Pseudomethylobacillus aquaticus]|uniref:tRNA(Ile)-lysidine synthase substrate-binding domain-containing protein n=1 Tax=Pseudomethylobacillus aquaticus TaxID=2676064 RepID=A0A3N0UZA9_9PROT|nr:hypothetical protein ED236_09250 [Pseudomethylobacillus aquaticus]
MRGNADVLSSPLPSEKARRIHGHESGGYIYLERPEPPARALLRRWLTDQDAPYPDAKHLARVFSSPVVE